MTISIIRVLSVLWFITGDTTAPSAKSQTTRRPFPDYFSSDDSLLAHVIDKFGYAFIYEEVYTEAKSTPSPFHYSRVVYKYHILTYNPEKARLLLVTTEFLKKKQKIRVRKSGKRVDKTMVKNFFTAVDTSGFLQLSMANLNDKSGPVRPDGTAISYSITDAGSKNVLVKTPKGIVVYHCDYPEYLVSKIPGKSEQRVIFLNILNRFFIDFLGWPGTYWKLVK